MPSKGVEFSRRGKALPLEEGHEFFQGKEHTQDVHVGGLIPGEGDLLRKGVCSGEQVSPPPPPPTAMPLWRGNPYAQRGEKFWQEGCAQGEVRNVEVLIDQLNDAYSRVRWFVLIFLTK